VAIALALKAAALVCLYAGWNFVPRADHGADLWITRADTPFVHNLANFDGAWFVRLAAIGYEKLASGDYDLAAETQRLGVMDELGYEQGLWPPEPDSGRFDRGYGFRHWPGFVWLVKIPGGLGLDYVWSAVALSNLFTVIYGVLLYLLARKDLGAAGAALAVALSQFHPGGYALSAAYNESMFLALAAGAMLAARNQRWWLCGLAAGAAAATRIFGLVLALPLACEWMAHRASQTLPDPGAAGVLSVQSIKSSLRGLLELPGLWWAVLIPLGTAAALVFFHLTAGDALVFTRVHEQNVYGQVNWPWLMLEETYRKGPEIWMKELPLHALLLAVLALSFRRVRFSYLLWMALFFLYHTSNGNHSYLRYQVQCLPMFIAIPALCREREWPGYAVLAVFAALFGLFGALYVNGYWVA